MITIEKITIFFEAMFIKIIMNNNYFYRFLEHDIIHYTSPCMIIIKNSVSMFNTCMHVSIIV